MHTVLVIEDSPLLLKIMAHLFNQHKDWQPVFCASYQEAELLLETSADLFFAAFVDLHLPDAPNGESIDLVLSYHLPCIVLTGSYNERRRDELLMKGVVDYIIKENYRSYEYAFRLLQRLERNAHVKILIAEDSEAMRKYIRSVLTPQCFQIIDVPNGNQALEVLKSQPDIDLLIVDHSMPGLTGVEVVKILRQKMHYNEIVIIGLSADVRGSLSAMFIKHGADDFLRKPFYPEELTCRIMSTLERRDLVRELRKAAQFDGLTGLHNRRNFYDEGTKLFQQASRNKHQLSVAMVDLDFFKKINDSFGHATGDVVLVTFAKELTSHFPNALIGRLGGEEFAIITDDSLESILDVLEHLREDCVRVKYALDAPPLSFSAGVYQGYPGSLEVFLHEADKYLYQAKYDGRGKTYSALSSVIISD